MRIRQHLLPCCLNFYRGGGLGNHGGGSSAGSASDNADGSADDISGSETGVS
jgi:hypothetical protein